MSWLRVDDGFAEHPKVIALGGPAARWAWLEILAYCARRQTGGVIPPEIHDILRRATPELLAKAEQVGLIDVTEDGRVVHDWPIYNGATVEERVAACLLSNPDASSNEIVKTIGGKRELVLRIIAQLREKGGSPVVPGNHPSRFPAGTQSVPLARARAPQPQVLQEPKAVTSKADAETNGPGLQEIEELEATTTASLRSP